MHETAPDEQECIPSIINRQSPFLPQAAPCFAQVLSMHWPHSVLPRDGAGGGAGAGAALAAAGLAVSASGADDADAAGAAVSEPVDFPELAAWVLSDAGVSAGFDSPPQASQVSEKDTTRTRGKRWARDMAFE